MDTHSQSEPKHFRVLSLDGGGAKGFYTLGVLDEIEKNIGKGRRLCECFDLIFGTSTGAIIAALLARGERAEDALKLYAKHVPDIMKPERPKDRTAALHALAQDVFGGTTLANLKTRVGIVATNWKEERPMIFKGSAEQAHGSVGSFVPFFGCSIADAVIGSCSAVPFFETFTVNTSKGITELGDGGFCANNPTLYAIAEATRSLKKLPQDIRVVSLGVGSYPPPSIWKVLGRVRGGWPLIKHKFSSDLLQKILDTNTGSMDQLRMILFKDISTLRISDAFVEPEMATDLLEHDGAKLNRLVQKGRRSFETRETQLREFIDGN